MDKYASVEFGPYEVTGQKNFLKAMNGFRIIQITDEELEDHIRHFREEKIGTLNHIVLHGKEDVHLFEHIMKVFFPEKNYKITDDPDDPDFLKWLQEKEKKLIP